MVLIGLIVCLIPASSAVAAHPFHVSLAEVEFNPKSKNLEIALRVWPNDLERAIQIQNKKKINIEKAKNADELILKYLELAFVVKGLDGKAAKIKWVGKEISIKEAWLYFEVPMPKGVDGITFENRICFEVLDDQVNTIIFRSGKKRLSLKFTANSPKSKLDLKKLK